MGMDNKHFNSDVLLVCQISHTGLYQKNWTSDYIQEKLHLLRCAFLGFISVLKTDMAQLKLCIFQAFLVEMDSGDE